MHYSEIKGNSYETSKKNLYFCKNTLVILIYLYFSNVWNAYIKMIQMSFFYVRSLPMDAL